MECVHAKNAFLLSFDLYRKRMGITMKSIKPGRGPSMMSGVASIGAAIFGLIWTIAAASMGAGPFALFGLVFIGMAIASGVYNFKNATSENRYSFLVRAEVIFVLILYILPNMVLLQSNDL